MVHYVVKEVDRGEPVIVREVEIVPGEPIEAFEERLHAVEWKIIVEATAKVLDEVAPVKVSAFAMLRRSSNSLVARLYHSKMYHTTRKINDVESRTTALGEETCDLATSTERTMG